MRLNFLDKTILFLLSGIMIMATGVKADSAADYAKALEKGKKVAGSLQSYEIQSNLVMENNVKGQTGGMKLEATQVARAQMPDRIYLSIESAMFQQHLGCGPESSWFSLPAAGVCYVGPSLQLTRTFEDDGSAEMTTDKLFNFYAGLGDFIFTEDQMPQGEVSQEAVNVGGKDIPCRVFDFADQDGTSRFWFDPESGLVLKTQMVTVNQDQGVEMERVLTTTVSSFVLDQPLDDDKFQFEVPKDIRVVDSLERVMNPDSMVGQPAPDISFTDLDGKKVNLKDYRGKVVFIDFWATWCGPCRMEMPHIEKLYQELKSHDDLVFFGASNEDKKTVEGFLAKNKYNFSIVLVDAEDARGKFKVSSIPAGFVIDREGIIRAHMIGTQNEAQLRAAFAKGGFAE